MQTHAEPQRYALRAMLPLVAEDATRAWVHAARPGLYKGHHAGEFEFSAETFGQIVRNFESQINQVVPLTWDHPNYDGKSPVELAGWVHELKVDEHGLWAWCEFTPKAVELVRGGSYKFASVVVHFEAVHRESGEEIGAELLELALTSSPFIDGLKALSLTRQAPTTEPARAPLTKPSLFTISVASHEEPSAEEKTYRALRAAGVSDARARVLAAERSK